MIILWVYVVYLGNIYMHDLTLLNWRIIFFFFKFNRILLINGKIQYCIIAFSMVGLESSV
jgi:hypothetical protein